MPGGFHYRVTVEGDLILYGVQASYADPADAPYYAQRDSIKRVITTRGATIGARALAGFPALRVAILSGARSVGSRAFAGCPRLAAVLTDPTTHAIAEDAFASCPSLRLFDYAGPPATALTLLPPALTASGEVSLRTVPSANGDTIAEGALGRGVWRLTADGTLTVAGDDIPDYPSYREVPWYPHRDAIRHVTVSEGVGRVGANAFALLPALQTASVTAANEIGEFAFAYCKALRRADIFATVTALRAYAFAGSGLRVAFPGASATMLGVGIYDECPNLRTLLLPFLPLCAEGDPIGRTPALTATLYHGDDTDRATLRGIPHLRPLQRLPLPRAAARAAERAEAKRERVALALHTVEDGYRDADAARRAVLSRLGNALHSDNANEDNKRELNAAARDARRLSRLLRRLADRTERLLGKIKEAQTAIGTAEGHAALLFPFDGAYTERLLDVRTYVDSVNVASPKLCQRAADRAARIPEQIAGGLAGDAMTVAADMAALLSGDGEGAGISAPPCVLILGGNPLRDATVAATARAVRRAGGIPAVNPANPQEGSYDALILCDGGAIDPYLYGAVRGNLPIDEQRNARDAAFFDALFLYGKQILGVGRGCLLVNILLGGTLSSALPQALLTRHSGGAVHPVLCDPGFLREVYGKDKLACISNHTEGLGSLGRELSVAARAEDGVVEAIAHRRLPIYGVMFAPERMQDPAAHPEDISDGTRLFAWFVTEARKNRKKRTI